MSGIQRRETSAQPASADSPKSPRVLVYSYFPMPQRHCAGGAQTFFSDLIRRLGERGLQFEVVCPAPPLGLELLSADGVTVTPLLRAPESQPLRFDERVANVRLLAELASSADVIWTLDEAFPLRVSCPVVSSLCTLAYPDEIQSVFACNWDVLVAASPFLERCVAIAVGPQWWESSPAPSIATIEVGIELERFRHSDSASLRARFRLAADDRCLLFPHRPEPEKGFDQALDLLSLLLQSDGRFKLLVPRDPKSIVSSLQAQNRFYTEFEQRVVERGLAASVVLHPWVDIDEMPAYFSLAEWCLAPSTLPEGFGMTPIQSIACGTPVVSTPCGSLRERFPKGHGVAYAPPFRPDLMAARILAGISPTDLARGMIYVRERYDIRTVARRYQEVLISARQTHRQVARRSGAQPQVVPWCYVEDHAEEHERSTVWHDLRGRRIQLSAAALAVLRTLQHRPDALPEMDRDVLAELTREQLLV